MNKFGPTLLRVAGCWSMLIWIYRWVSNTLLSQLVEPKYYVAGQDTIFKLFASTGLDQLLTSNAVSTLVDVGLLVFSVLSVVWNRRWVGGVLLLLWVLYHVTFHGYFQHHGHTLIGLQIVLFTSLLGQWLSWSGQLNLIRLFTAFLYTSAGVWKLTRLGFWEPGHLKHIIVEQINEWGPADPGHWVTQLSEMDGLLNIAFPLLLVFQLSFVLVIFTKKLDIPLMSMALGFHLLNWIILDIQFWELWIIYLPFVAEHWQQKWPWWFFAQKAGTTASL